MEVLICGKTYKDSERKFEEVTKEIRYSEVRKLVKSMSQTRLETINGDSYQTIPCSESARGHKCDKLYIHSEIRQEIIHCVLLPMLVLSKLPIEDQIEYFD